MNISKKGDYALRALLNLAIRYGEGVTPMATIAREEGVPKKFLEQILLALKGGGFVQSKSGVGGGYLLARKPSDVPLGDVIRLMDGKLAPIACVSKKFYISCPKEKTCAIRSIMLDVRNVTAQILENITLADLCDRVRGRTKRKMRVLKYYV